MGHPGAHSNNHCDRGTSDGAKTTGFDPASRGILIDNDSKPNPTVDEKLLNDRKAVNVVRLIVAHGSHLGKVG